MKVLTLTLGCKVNQYDSEALLEALAPLGYERAAPGEEADLVVVNTCAVTAAGEAKSRQALHQARRRHPGARIAAAGCLVERLGADAARRLGADLAVGTAEPLALVRLVNGEPPRPWEAAVEVFTFQESGISRSGERTRATVKVQEGCDQRCSYCLIPSLRGPSRSRPLRAVVAEISRLVGTGVAEVVLTGTHLGAYGREGDGGDLAELLAAILADTEVKRIRLSSVEASEVPEALLPLLAEERVANFLHLPLQSGSDRILAAMGRPYRVTEYLERTRRFRASRPDLGLGADVLVGFPGESEADFAATVAAVRAAGLGRLHVFPYSERPGTPAAEFPGSIPLAERRARAAELRQVGEELAGVVAEAAIGREVLVLAERRRGGRWEGYTGDYQRVAFPGPPGQAGQLRRVLIQGREGPLLLGDMI